MAITASVTEIVGPDMKIIACRGVGGGGFLASSGADLPLMKPTSASAGQVAQQQLGGVAATRKKSHGLLEAMETKRMFPPLLFRSAD